MYAIDNKDKTKVIVCDEIPDGYSEIYEEDYLKIAGDALEVSNNGIENFDVKGYDGVNAEPSFSLDAKTGTVLGDVVQARTTMLAPTATQTDGLYVVNLTYLNTKLKDYASIVYVDQQIVNVKTYINTALANYYTKAESDNKYQLKLGYTPVQTGTGIDQLTNVVKIGWGDQTKYAGRVRITIDNTDMGNIVTDAFLNHGTLPAYFSNLYVGVNPAAINFGTARIYGNIIHTNYVRGLSVDGAGILFNNTNGRPILEVNNSPIATLLDITNNQAKIGGLNRQTAIGTTYIMGYVDPSSRMGYIRVKSPPMSSSYDAHVTFSPAELCTALGFGVTPTQVLIDDYGSFASNLQTGAISACTWFAATVNAPTPTYWEVQAYCNLSDGARVMGYTWSIIFKF